MEEVALGGADWEGSFPWGTKCVKCGMEGDTWQHRYYFCKEIGNVQDEHYQKWVGKSHWLKKDLESKLETPEALWSTPRAGSGSPMKVRW